MYNEPDLVCVRTCHGLDVAQIYKSKLEAMDIPVLLKHEAVGAVYGITLNVLGEVRIMVPSQYAREAEALLVDIEEDAEGAADEDPFDDEPLDEEPFDEEPFNGEPPLGPSPT
jgi:hypothetical protein